MCALRLGSRKLSYFCLTVRPCQYTLRHYSDEKPKDTNLYDSLGIKSSATPAEIKQAYYDLSFKYHPDRNKDSVEASDKFRKVTEAYEVLGNYGLRKRYDKGLPLPSKRSTISQQPIVETELKYQTFFDSRTKSQKNKSEFRGILGEEDMSNVAAKKKFTARDKMMNEKFVQSQGQGWLIVFFVVGLMLLVKYMKN